MGIWVEIINDIKHEEYYIYASKLRVQSCATPRNIQIVNMKHFPLLYPDSICPCKGGICNEFHILCKCKFLKDRREAFVKQAHKRFTEWIQPQMKDTHIPMELIRYMFFPQEKENFKYGFIHVRLKEWAILHGYTEVEWRKWISKLERELLECYHSLWNSFTQCLVHKKLTLNDRVKEVYKINKADMIHFKGGGVSPTSLREGPLEAPTLEGPMALPS
jgi:hypothetical protein